ncbi:M1 family metallopeptidase [Patescibacteria group bacterium]|nr:M1 family metallopeptidase [Patescibacteria group bacterium]
MPEKPLCLLPDYAEPRKYQLWIEPHLENFAFDGRESIEIDILEPIDTLTLHAADLTIQSAKLRNSFGSSFNVNISLDKDNKRVTFSLEKIAAPGKYHFDIEYRGEINDQMCGLYRSMYTLPDGTKRYMATTQCEAIDARRIFPCLDEPARKAVFELSVTIPSNLTALSNMPVAEEWTRDGMKLVKFQPTPRMSTYLFAVIVGEFEYVEGKTKNNIVVRVHTTPGKKEFGYHALKRGIRVLEEYTDYFGVAYPLPKMDMVAIPDFAAGAMENWGLETFRETALLVDPKNSSAAMEERVDEVVDHEFAHQWHGDLVTMVWWNGLWLNEGFASWMELIAAHRINPELHPEDKFIAEDFVAALNVDALKTSRPIHVVINHDNQINECFDGIAYSKGASIIRMIENFLGPEIFRSGLQRYMKKHAYGNTEPEDLWRALEEASGKPVTAMMDKWIKQVGYPIIHVERKNENGKTTLCLSQERFLYERNEAPAEAITWDVPIGITVEGNSEHSFVLLDRKSMEADLASLSFYLKPEEWVKLNSAHTGFFRVHYEASELLKFKTAVSEKKLSVADRIELCDDAYALTRSGYYSGGFLLDFLSAYKKEIGLRVWQVLLGRLDGINLLAAGESYAKPLESYTRDLLSEIASRVGWVERPDDTHHTKMLRGMVLGAYGQAGDPTTISWAREQFAAFLKDHAAVSPNLRRTVYGIVAAYGNAKTHDTLWQLYQKFTLQEEQVRLLGSLTDFRDPELLLRTLNLFISGEVRPQNVYPALRSIATNPAGRDLTWKFVKENWGAFCRMYEKGKLLGRVIEAVCKPLASFNDEADVKSFFASHQVPEAMRTIEQALESIRVNASWRERDRINFALRMRHYNNLR